MMEGGAAIAPVLSNTTPAKTVMHACRYIAFLSSFRIPCIDRFRCTGHFSNRTNPACSKW